MTSFRENVQKPKFLTHFNPQIKIFFKILAVSLFLLHVRPTSWKVSEKTNEWSHKIFKDRPMDQRTNKGDYHGHHWVNQGSQIKIDLLPESSASIKTNSYCSNKCGANYNMNKFVHIVTRHIKNNIYM